MDSSIAISAATVADYPAFARLFVELAVPEAPPSLERFMQAVVPGTLVARAGDAVVGYGWFRARGDRVHVVHLVTDPSHRGHGVGRALMNAIAERGRARGATVWMLNVRPDNVAARALYSRCGLVAAFEATSMGVRWTDVDRLPSRADVTTRVLAPSDDGAFEDAFGLPHGDLAGFRADLGRIVVGAELDGVAVGVAAFDPGFPGASPFRVRAPEFARSVLDACRPHALPKFDSIFAFVENDPPLEAALIAVGGKPALRALRMEGPIPSA